MKNIILTLALLLTLSSCKQQEQSNSSASATASTKIQTVEVVRPQNRSFTAQVLVSGTVQPNQMVKLYAMESGVLSQMRKDIGDKVNKGEVIAVLQNPSIDEMVATASADLALAKSKIGSAKADLEATKAKLAGLQSMATRLKDVYVKTPQLMTVADLENAHANAKEAQAMVQSKEAFIASQEAAVSSKEVSFQAAQKRLSFLNVKAPFSGIVTKRFVDKGALLQSGMSQSDPQAIVEIQEINPVRLRLPVPESDAVAIKKGMAVDLSFPELSGEVYKAQVSRTSGVLDPMSKTMQVEIDIDNAKGNILTGMYAKAVLKTSSRENILSLPVNAKVRYKNEDYVLAVQDKIVKRIPIKIGLSDKDFFEVLNAEITNETLVVTNGKGLVSPGQTVEAIMKLF